MAKSSPSSADQEVTQLLPYHIECDVSSRGSAHKAESVDLNLMANNTQVPRSRGITKMDLLG
jgi:hypothetical protein